MKGRQLVPGTAPCQTSRRRTRCAPTAGRWARSARYPSTGRAWGQSYVVPMRCRRAARRAHANGTLARPDRSEALAHGERDVTGDRARLPATSQLKLPDIPLKGGINMRAVQLTSFGNPVDGLEYVDIPEPDATGPNQVLIGVEFSPSTQRPYGRTGHLCSAPRASDSHRQ